MVSERLCPRRMPMLRVLLLAGLFLASLSPSSAAAEPDVPEASAPTGAESNDRGEVATREASSATAAAEPDEVPSVLELKQKSAKIRQLLEGSLPLGELASALFDIPIDDEEMVQVDRRRIEELLAENSDVKDQGPLAGLINQVDKKLSSTPATTEEPERAAPLLPTPAGIDPGRWAARLDLDRARLDFYQLPLEERRQLLLVQENKEQADLESKREQALTSVDKDAAQAERDEQAALAAARNSRSEAERSVHAEMARLLGIAKEQAEYEKGLIERRAAAAAKHDEALKIRRQLSDEIEQREANPSFAGPHLDLEYDSLRKRLKEARRQLGTALDELIKRDYRVPVPGTDRLTELPDEIDRARVDALRLKLQAATAVLEAKEHEYLEERARLLMAEVDMLNRLRLRAISQLSVEKRNDLEAFNSIGFDQARSEARQVWLTLRYHLQATQTWAKHIRSGKRRTESAWVASLLALKWLFPVGILLWWRRRSEKLLNLWISHAKKEAPQRVTSDETLDLSLSLPLFLKRVHRPLEYLLLIWSVLYLMPPAFAELLEVQLPATIMLWTFGGALTVATIDALSSNDLRQYPARGLARKSPALRLRSLQLIGRTIVVFGLILDLSSQLVGKGTIFSWVFSTCWFAAIPVSLVVVAWWKPVIYERLELIRKKGKLAKWVLEQKQGPTSFVAAIAGGTSCLVLARYECFEAG